jgi:hypothetical protein
MLGWNTSVEDIATVTETPAVKGCTRGCCFFGGSSIVLDRVGSSSIVKVERFVSEIETEIDEDESVEIVEEDEAEIVEEDEVAGSADFDFESEKEDVDVVVVVGSDDFEFDSFDFDSV